MEAAESPPTSTDDLTEDFSQMCRLCLSGGELQPIQETAIGNLQVHELMEYSIALPFDKNDCLPQNICTNCSTNLHQMYEFIQQSNQNETSFRIKKEPGNNTDEEEEDLTQICRVCRMLEPESLRLISDTVVENTEASVLLETCLGIQYEESDTLPKNICDNCLTNLYQMYEFQEKCHENETILKLKTAVEATFDESIVKSFKPEEIPEEELHKQLLERRMKNRKYNQVRKECTICMKMVLRRGMREHLRTHTHEKPFACEACPLRFSLKANLKRHSMIHTGERPYTCETCGRGFIQAACLQSHTIACFGGQVSKKCPYCESVFYRESTYKIHLRTHKELLFPSSDAQYFCDNCPNFYSSKQILQQHIKMKHVEKTFLCCECGARFANASGLKIHSRKHTGDKPYECGICKKSFTQSGTLSVHMWIHKNQKSFTCNYCGRTFCQKGHLLTHLKTHTGERPYKCPYCDKAFALNGNLTVHIRIHTGEKPFECPICKKGFYSSTSMKKHKLRHRGRDITTQRNRNIHYFTSNQIAVNNRFVEVQEHSLKKQLQRLRYQH